MDSSKNLGIIPKKKRKKKRIPYLGVGGVVIVLFLIKASVTYNEIVILTRTANFDKPEDSA